MYKTDDYDFDLPDHLIAQTPLENRQASKLLVVDRKTNKIEHKHFYDIIEYLNQDDVLVLNNTRVLPARLIGVKVSTNAKIEILMLKEVAPDTWECLCKPAKRVHLNDEVTFGEGKLIAICTAIKEDGLRVFELKYEGILLEVLEELGTMPLPPYIKESLADQERYQTIYSKVSGSAAAPTAGLHFTDELMQALKAKGVKIAYLTLHVGLGTFRPVSVEDVLDHKMHSEIYELDNNNAIIINEALKKKHRIISVGTTSTRTLESIYAKYSEIRACHGETDIFIYPGFTFNVVNAQITNFHLPKSTLMMLVSAFATKELIMEAYQDAISNKYRFFSFGDSMLIK